MTRLIEHVSVSRRFQRSIRVDTDYKDPGSLDGFVCPASSAEAVISLARHVAETGHAAFTWTGPYGSGKSSLVVALCAALAGKPKLREVATKALGEKATTAVATALPAKSQGWHIIAITGRRAPLSQLIGEALELGGHAKRPSKGWTDEVVLRTLASLAASDPRTHGGVLVVVDEMGKVLEGAAHGGHDVYLLQQVAEIANRSDRRLLFLGILHQAFDEYAQRLSREIRDEWSKVQGRFVDIVVNASGDEQLELLARAIAVDVKPQLPKDVIQTVAEVTRAGKPSARRHTADLLMRCWPLHPVVASLLGPISRRRFGQNQRSLFAFLNSAEPNGFHDFLTDARGSDLYMPAQLWNYLRSNLEPAILASPDGHRWSVGADALERCLAAGASNLEIDLLKTIALIDLFRERSGLVATSQLLAHSVGTGVTARQVDLALKSLVARSCIVYRRHQEAYALYAGSDFDIDGALAQTMPAPNTIDLAKLRQLAGLQPVLAKRHYHTTGAIRWFDIELASLHDLNSVVGQKARTQRAAGRFVIAIPTESEAPTKARRICEQASASAPPTVVIGLSEQAWHVVHLAREFMALTTIHDERPELRGDTVARREVLGRLNGTRANLEQHLQQMVEQAIWFRPNCEPTRYSASNLNSLASDISDDIFADSPHIHNELLNRDFPSSNAVKAQRDLMKRMLSGAGQHRLGINGWPAEAGLMESILIRTGLYHEDADGHWQFSAPPKNHSARLSRAWQAGLRELRLHKNTMIGIGQLFNTWRQPPYGIKEGLLPIFALALYLVNRDRLAIYRQGVFQPEMSELDVDLMTSDVSHIQLRWMELGEPAKEILSGLQDLAVRLDPCSRAASGAPLDIARSLVTAFDALPDWTKRTTSVSPSARKLAEILRYASDPNRLLFDDVPNMADKRGGKSNKTEATIQLVSSAFDELTATYPAMLRDLESIMLMELDVPDFETLRSKAANLLPVASDLKMKAFIQRLAHYRDTLGDMERIASLATEKKPGDWSDADVIRAKSRIAELAQQFKHLEEIARVTGRPDGRQRMSVIVPREGLPRAIHTEFIVSTHESADVSELITKLEATLRHSSKTKKNVILAALAELSARYMDPAHGRTKKRAMS